MKLSNLYKVQHLIAERTRLRDTLADTMADTDIKIELRGREAQGVVRARIREALIAAWQADLRENGEMLKSLGVEPDDPPVRPTEKPQRVELPND